MSASPIRIQLAIQGGGAKIAALMAALEEIDDLQSKGIIKVTRISGTSAGAIVGAVFASGPLKVQMARERLVNLKPKAVRKMFPAPWPPKKPHLLAKLLAGKPMWKIAAIEKLLLDMLQDKGLAYERISDLSKIPGRNIILKIIATNLSNSEKAIYEGKDSLVPSLLHSCGLPYCFRTWSKSGSPVIVDGGICENLPTDELDHPAAILEFGPIVGISFAKSKQQEKVDNALSFSAALLETSMQNSMERAKQRLGDGNTLSILTSLTTFDLAGAIEKGLDYDGAYGNVRNQTQKWFTDFIDRIKLTSASGSKTLVGDPWANQGIELMDKLGEMYQSHHSERRVKYKFCSVIVQLKGLAGKDHEDFGQPDLVRYKGEFQILNDTIFCQRLNISDTVHQSALARTRWNLTDLATRRKIKSIDLPIRTPGSPADKARELLLFWDPPLAPGTGPYRIEFEDQISAFMKPLSLGQEDDLFCSARQGEGVVDQIDLILFVPESSRNLWLSEKDGVPGRLLTATELDRYEAPVGYKPFGWTGSNIPAGTDFGVNVRLA